MRRKGPLGVMVLTCVAAACGLCRADPSEGDFFISLYTDHRAHQIGDLVLVVISESSISSHSASRSNDRSAESKVGPGAGWLDFIPLVGYGGESTSAAKGQSARRDMLTARIATMVTGVTPTGSLIIEGERTVQVNDDFQTIRLTGEVRPQDIGPDNTALSHRVANARIEYVGRDPGEPGRRLGIITRILNWLF